jgi:hypothetical protein
MPGKKLPQKRTELYNCIMGGDSCFSEVSVLIYINANTLRNPQVEPCEIHKQRKKNPHFLQNIHGQVIISGATRA